MKKISARNSSAGQDLLHVFDIYPVSCAKANDTGHKAKKKKKENEKKTTHENRQSVSFFSRPRHLQQLLGTKRKTRKKRKEKRKKKRKKRKKKENCTRGGSC